MQYDIRKPTRDNVKEIERLFGITIRYVFKEEGIVDLDNTESDKEIEALKQGLGMYFSSKGMGDDFLIANCQGKIVGTIAYGEPNDLICENLKVNYPNTPEIKSVYVLPSHQNAGIGTLLLKSMLNILKQNKIEYFCLDSGYKKAQHYWKNRLGEPQCVLGDYWGKDNHHMIWHCEVEGILKLNNKSC